MTRFLCENKGNEYVSQLINSKTLLEKEEEMLMKNFLGCVKNVLDN